MLLLTLDVLIPHTLDTVHTRCSCQTRRIACYTLIEVYRTDTTLRPSRWRIFFDECSYPTKRASVRTSQQSNGPKAPPSEFCETSHPSPILQSRAHKKARSHIEPTRFTCSHVSHWHGHPLVTVDPPISMPSSPHAVLQNSIAPFYWVQKTLHFITNGKSSANKQQLRTLGIELRL